MPDEEGIVIDDTQETQGEETEVKYDTEGLTDGEIELAKEHGFIKEEEEKNGTDDEQPEPKTDEDSESESEEEQEEEKVEEHPSFEDVENDEKLIDKYNKNEKALYWKWKTDKHKRQEAQKEAESLRVNGNVKDAVDSGVSGKKLEKIKKLLENPDTLTIESLQATLDEEVEPDKKPDELDNAQAIQQKVALKAQFAEKIGSAKYDNFEGISKLAKEVINDDKSGTYQKLIEDSFLNDAVDENMLVERVISIARMSPKYNEVVNNKKVENKEEVDRVIKNSKKKPSSASVSGASGKRIISESELTVEQATKLSDAQWWKLKPETRERILRGKNP